MNRADRVDLVVTHDLRQKELGVKERVGKVIHLPLGIGVRIGPSAEADRPIALPQHLSQLPRMLDRSGSADRPVAAEHDQRGKPVLARALGVRQAVFERMLRRQKRHDARARDVLAEIGHEMAQVVFFLRTDGAVGEKHERVLPRQASDGVIGVDPRVHALAGGELGARRTQLRREHGRAANEAR